MRVIDVAVRPSIDSTFKEVHMKKILTFTSLAVVACLTMVSPARGQQNKDIVIDHVLLPPGE